MKKILKLTALFLAVITLSACQKENTNRLIIEAEGMNGSKLAIDGNTSYWATGDQVYINGTTYDVSISQSGQAYVDLGDNNTLSDPFYGVYPASIFNGISQNNSDNFILRLPHDYQYATYDGHQNLQSPMLAYQSGNSNKLFFKHFTGAIAVEITNNFGFDVNVTGITVSSNKYKLSGDCEYGKASIAGDNVNVGGGVAAIWEGVTELERRVQMLFEQTSLTIASGETKTVQIPVLPVGSDNRFTITVTVQSLFNDNVYTFTKTQAGNSSDSYALGRAQIGYAPAKFGGVFSINADGDKVRFSPGNLQYQASTNTWRFAGNQYDIIGSSNSNISDSYNGWIDLFGWGTGNAPTQSSTNNADYSTFTDWGNTINSSITNNTIGNTGISVGSWRTLTAAEWYHLLISRNDAYLKVGYGEVLLPGQDNNIKGLFILPDEFVDPKLNRNNSEGLFRSYYYGGGFVANSYSYENWVKMEAAGAIFLPVEAYRYGTNAQNESTTGHYWSSTYYSADQAKVAIFDEYRISVNDNDIIYRNRYYGCSVRLVRTN